MVAHRLTLTAGRIGAASAAAVIGLATLATVADAKVGGGRSFGSRGSNTYSAPPPTATAPKAAPMERSMTPQPGRPTAGQAGPTAGAATAAQQATRGGSMMRNILLGGLIGAGLATIFGAGAFANVLGFLLQGLLIGGLIWLAVAFFMRRRMGTPATAQGPAAPMGRMAPQNAAYRQGSAPTGAGTQSRGPAVGPRAVATAATTTPLTLGQADFESFERLLGEVQGAYGRADINALGDRMTPEMLSYLAADLDADARKGVRNEISDVKLLQGDLSESWSEATGEYATVAMRFEMRDRVIDVATGRVVEGSSDVASEATELWTFRRQHGGTPQQWDLSAIQQAA